MVAPPLSVESTGLKAPATIVCGGGALREQLGGILRERNLTKPLIVTDKVLAHAIGEAKAALGDDVEIFDEVATEPSLAHVDKIKEAMRRCEPDVLVALGGGSPIDAAKAANVLFERPLRSDEPVVARLPLVAIPTTSGTGSEVTAALVVADGSEKVMLKADPIIPSVALLDYTLTLTMPRSVSAMTGIDSLCHAMEAHVSRRATAETSKFALAALERIGRSLVRACAGGDSDEAREAREEMCYAAFEAGVAFSNASVTLIHGMSRPLGRYHVPHGLANAQLAPCVTRFSLPGATDRYAQVARALGFAGADSADADAAAALPDALEHLVHVELNLPRLAASVPPLDEFLAAVPTMVSEALASGSPDNNPVLATADEAAALYRKVVGAE